MTVKNTLKQCAVFAMLSSAELEKVASLADSRRYEAGTTIFKEQTMAEELLVIEEGRVALQIEVPVVPPQLPRRVTVDVVNKSEIAGWSAFLEPGAYILTAVCLQNTRALAINTAKLRALMREDAKLGYEILSGLIRVINSRLHETFQVLVSERAFASEMKG